MFNFTVMSKNYKPHFNF